MSPPAIHTLSLHDALPILLLDPGQVEDLVMRELGDTALFGARFRENAGRALLIPRRRPGERTPRSEEHTSELQSLTNLVCRLLLEKKKKTQRLEGDKQNNR